MLARLRHHRFVRCHYEQNEIDAANAGQHVFHEPLVPGNIDEREVDVLELSVRKAKVDGDAARLLFFQAIGIGAGQRLHQRALAVIDMASGPDDDRLHRK